ncbi:MAG: FecR domain-containing protein, partial [Candidatus Eremiobacteraeota bacterium]|nr:FecR domain-containing protein [Candidatus Eremiobacteraeota bacterium]
MRLFPRLLSLGAAAAAAVAFGLLAASAAQAAPPGVVFVSSANGNVFVQRGDSGVLEPVAVNAPLMVGDTIVTEPGARAAIDVDSGHVVRLGPGSHLRLARLERRHNLFQLASGTAGLGVVRDPADYTLIETPSAQIEPTQVGYSSVVLLPNGRTAVTVRSGRDAILLPQGPQYLIPGNTLDVWGPPT